MGFHTIVWIMMAMIYIRPCCHLPFWWQFEAVWKLFHRIVVVINRHIVISFSGSWISYDLARLYDMVMFLNMYSKRLGTGMELCWVWSLGL